MSEVIDLETGEIKYATDLAPVDPKSDIAVTSYLQQARDWLATAVETTGPEQIAAAKAEIATAAEATKQLGLSKEIQLDAQEMVRRAEYALGKAIRKGQAEGVVTPANDITTIRRMQTIVGHEADGDERVRPSDLASRSELYGARPGTGIYALSDEVEDHEFETAIAEARAEDNLSRANVTRKVAERTGKQRATRRAPLTDFARDASYDLLKVAERLQRVIADDRFSDNRAAIRGRAAGQINRAAELIAEVQAALNSETTP